MNLLLDKIYGEDRVTIDGLRHYNVAGIGKPLPSVTSVLSAVQPDSAKQRLIDWNLNNPGELRKAGERGTWIHNAAENYFLGYRVDPKPEYAPFWEGMPEVLDEIKETSEIIWTEQPVGEYKDLWPHAVSASGLSRVAYFNSATGQGYSGAPDLIYKEKQTGKIVLADFKTSTCPYLPRSPKAEVWEKEGITKQQARAFYAGVLKYQKCAAQIAAYAFACDFFLDLQIDKFKIIVSTPDVNERWSTQSFTLSPWEMERAKNNWITCYKAFWNKEKVDPFSPCRGKRPAAA